jgi:hypothetical protein
MLIEKGKTNWKFISIVFVLAVLVGGFTIWQYSEIQKEEIGSDVKLSEDRKDSFFEEGEEIVRKFMNERIKVDAVLYTLLPENVKTANTDYGVVLTSFSKIVLTTPRLASYEIMESKKIDSSKVQISTKSYLENEKGEKVGYYDESFTINSKSNRPIVFVEQSDYKSLIKEDECRDLARERDYCYFRTAFERGDINLCDKIEGTINKHICYMVVAIRNNDFSICQQYPEILDMCAFRFGVSNLDENFCEESTSKRNLCIYRVAVVKNDSSLCARITDDHRNSKTACENYFQETKEETFGGESIRIIRPKPYQEISSPIKIEGRYIGKIYIKIEDNNNYQLALESIETKSGLPFYHPFSISLPYSQTSSAKGVIKVFTLSEKDAINRIIVIPVDFKETPVLLPQAPEPPEWKTYRNEEEGYEIEYPVDWSHYCIGGLKQDFCNFCNRPPFEGVELKCLSGSNNISLSGSLDITVPDFCELYPYHILCSQEGVTSKEIVVEEIVVDGRKGKLFEIKTENMYYKYAFWKKNPNDTKTHELSVMLGSHPEFEEVFDRMISTFKFISDGHPLLSESQEEMLEAFGVDVSTLPSELTPEMEECFIEKLGEQRVNEIIGGATPNIFDFLKAKSCIEN